MKSIVFYYTPKPTDETDIASVVTKKKRRDAHTTDVWQVEVGLRAEIVNGGVARALDNAKPRKGEIVLNSAPYEG